MLEPAAEEGECDRNPQSKAEDTGASGLRVRLHPRKRRLTNPNLDLSPPAVPVAPFWAGGGGNNSGQGLWTQVLDPIPPSNPSFYFKQLGPNTASLGGGYAEMAACPRSVRTAWAAFSLDCSSEGGAHL